MEYPIRTPEQLGAVLKGYRAARRLTQNDLGTKIGMGQVAISDFERAPGKSSIQRLYRVLSGLGLELVLREVPKAPAKGKSSSRKVEW